MLVLFIVGNFFVSGQNCEVDFPGIGVRNFSTSCGGSSIANLSLGRIFEMGGGDVFVFNAPAVININGNFHVEAQGNGKIVIPPGVTVNIGGNFRLDPRNGGCTSANPCTFEIEVQGTLNFLDDFDNSVVNLIWSGTGSVVVVDRFRNSNNGCMDCAAGGCPNFDVNPAECRDDGSGCSNSDFCATVTNPCSSDNVDPTFAGCPSNQVVNIAGAGCTQTVSWTPPTASDNCTLSSVTPSHPPGYAFPKGTTTVTYTARDAAGNTSICSFNVTVVDNTPPTISGCPTNITVNANASCQAVVSWTAPTVADNCGSATITPSKAPGTIFNKGTTVVTYTARDVAGNTSTCSFNVTVVDNTRPVISGCPANITVNANASCQAVVSWTPPTFVDNCLGAMMTPSKEPGTLFNKGTTVVTYTASDAAGNTSTCSFNVTVLDNAAPTIAGCPANITVNANASCQAVVNWTPPNTSDCSPTTLVSDKVPGSVFSLGTTRVNYVVTDEAGRTATCSFTVTVVDVTAPAIGECHPIKVVAGSNCRANASWSLPTVSDCDDVQIISSHEPGDSFSFGTTNVKYTARDAAGNTSACSFQVVVENEFAPRFSNCPADIFLEADELGGARAEWTPPTATVSCGQLTITSSHQPGTFSTGTTEAVYEAVDDLGKKSVCAFRINVAPPHINVEVGKVLTPDGNNINDHLEIANIEKFKDNRISIVDRWGSVVFKADGYDNGKIVWAGTNMTGGQAPSGTYFYTLSITYGSQSIQRTGFIELLR